MVIHSLTYVSVERAPFTAKALQDLLATSMANNARLRITGMLLYKSGCFMQVLEGSAASVHLIYTRIERDSRHQHLKVIVRQPVKERDFPNWSMGFHDLGSTDLTVFPGYSEFLDIPLADEQFSSDASRSQKLLSLFKQRF
jgi:hypothetical protein